MYSYPGVAAPQPPPVHSHNINTQVSLPLRELKELWHQYNWTRWKRIHFRIVYELVNEDEAVITSDSKPGEMPESQQLCGKRQIVSRGRNITLKQYDY